LEPFGLRVSHHLTAAARLLDPCPEMVSRHEADWVRFLVLGGKARELGIVTE
jgi:hypothetical protein